MANAKRKRENETLAKLFGDGSISIQSLQRVLKQLRDNEVPAGTRHQLVTQYKERVRHVLHTERLHDTNGHLVDWSFCEPGKLLQYVVESSPQLQEIYAAAANAHRGEWSCIVTFDEVVPGNKLKLNNQRKAMTLCFSFLELGRRCLQIPCVWLLPVFCRASLYNKVEGGWSYFLCIYLERQFLSANGLQTAGIPLKLKGQWFLLKAKLVHLLSDGDGLRISLNWKGAGSLRPCWCHWNVTKRASNIVDHSTELVDIASTEHGRFQKQTDAMVEESVLVVEAAAARYAAGGMTKTMYETICTSRGLTYNRRGLLWNQRVRRMVTQDVVTVDWVHTTLCDGAFGCDCYLFLNSSEEKVQLGFEGVRVFLLDGWAFPKQRRAQTEVLTRVFNNFRHVYAETHDKLKASASELLCVYGLMRHWVLIEFQNDDRMAQEVASFNACCQVVDVLLLTKRGHLTLAEGARRLRAATTRFLDLHKACYGSENLKPKHHWLYDIAEQWENQHHDHECVPDAFLVEKEHLVAKPIADRVRNTSVNEVSILAGALNSQVESLSRLGSQCELMGNCLPMPGFPQASVADNLEIEGVGMSVDDVVFYNDTPGIILACAREGNDYFVIVSEFALHTRLSAHSGNYILVGRRVLWSAKRVSVALAWRRCVNPAGGFTILLC